MAACNACPLGELAITNCMKPFGSGKILIVLSSPSGEDDINGELGNGENYKQLKELCSQGGIEASSYTVTTAIRCGLPKIYHHVEDSTEECRVHMRGMLESQDYSRIIAFGNIALKSLTKKSGIKTYRGKTLSLHKSFEKEIDVYPTYGLEDLRRVPMYKNTIISDLKNAVGSLFSPQKVSFIYWRANGSPNENNVSNLRVVSKDSKPESS